MIGLKNIPGKPAAKMTLRIGSAALLLAFCAAISFGFATATWADVKVRSYDRGTKTESSLKAKGGKGRVSGKTAGRTGGKGRAGRPAPEDDFEPGEILVANAPRNFQADMAGLNLKLIEKFGIKKLGIEVLRLKLPEGQSVKKSIRNLATRYPSAAIDANHRYDMSATTTRPRFPRQLAGWSKVPADCGKGVRIGMIDGAVDVRSPALKGQNIVFRSFHDKTRNPATDQHGTSIATLLIGKPMRNGWSGLLPGAQLFAASMFEIDRQDQVVGNSGGLLKALDWLISNNVKVVNMSIAGADNKAVASAIKKARRAGVILIASVGNWGYRGEAAYPAGYRDVIAVTAIGKRNKILRGANQGRYVDFSAPGEGVWVPVGPKGQLGDGTSYAAPFITVLAGLHVARGQRADPEILRRSLRRQTVDLGKKGRDMVYGWGLVRAFPTCNDSK
jgi:hypothetical protein